MKTSMVILGLVCIFVVARCATDYRDVPVGERDSIEELAGSYVDGPCRLDLHKDLTYAFAWADGATTGTYDIDAQKDIAITVYGFSPRNDFPNEKSKYEFQSNRSFMPLYAVRKLGGPLTLEIYGELHPVLLERVE